MVVFFPMSCCFFFLCLEWFRGPTCWDEKLSQPRYDKELKNSRLEHVEKNCTKKDAQFNFSEETFSCQICEIQIFPKLEQGL